MKQPFLQIAKDVITSENLKCKFKSIGDNMWRLKIYTPYGNIPAKIEITIDTFDNADDRGARGCVFHYGDVSRNQISNVMNSIMERV